MRGTSGICSAPDWLPDRRATGLIRLTQLRDEHSSVVSGVGLSRSSNRVADTDLGPPPQPDSCHPLSLSDTIGGEGANRRWLGF